jgi:hypothetical protein
MIAVEKEETPLPKYASVIPLPITTVLLARAEASHPMEVELVKSPLESPLSDPIQVLPLPATMDTQLVYPSAVLANPVVREGSA